MNPLKESDTPWKKLKLFAWSSQESLKMRRQIHLSAARRRAHTHTARGLSRLHRQPP